MSNDWSKQDYYEHLVKLNKAIDEIRRLQREVEGVAGASIKDNRLASLEEHLTAVQNIVAGTVAKAIAHRAGF